MAISRWAAAVDALIAALQADATLATVPAEVIDGPPTGQVYRDVAVYVGFRGDEDDPTAGTVQQEWRTVSPDAKRDEVLTIDCIAEAVRGDNNMALARTAATAALGAVESALRADPDLGLADVAWLEVSDSSVQQFRDADGAVCRHLFTVTVKSVI